MILTDESVVMIEIARLHDYPLQENVYGETGADIDSAFIDNVSRFGILTPLVVAPYGNNPDDPQYMIISGHRRKWAAGSAGLDFVPCITRNYESEEVRDLHFLSFNKDTREKTRQQRVNEFLLYKQKLSQCGEVIKNKKVHDIEDIRYDELVTWLRDIKIDPEEPFNTLDIIQEQTGFSRHFQECTTIIFDDIYFGRVQGKLNQLKITEKEWADFYKQWMAAREKVLNTEISLKSAAEQLKAFVRDHEQKLLMRIKGKKEKPVKPAKPRIPEQTSLFREEDDSTKEFMQYREYCKSGGLQFSFVFNKNAPDTPVGLAFAKDDKLFRINLAGLAEYIDKEMRA